MTNEQMIHISMVNSYNVLIEGASIDEIIRCGVGIFCHSYEEKDAKKSIEFMINYFQNLEMYERCSKLQEHISNTFNEDGTFKDVLCDCIYPEIEEYKFPVKCKLCSLTIKT